MGGVDDVRFDCKIIANELGGITIVGENATHASSGQIDVTRTLLREESVDRLRIGQIQVRVSPRNQVIALLAVCQKASDDRAPYKAGVPGNIDSFGHFAG